MTQSVLILGANGRFGGAAAHAFAQAGWDVRKFDRAQDNLNDAVRAVDVVVNAWHPPTYATWAQDLLAMHEKVIKAVRGTETTVILPGNVYVYGAETPGPWGPKTAHNASNLLGKLRIEQEAAYRESAVRTIILRSGDFLDTQASGAWFDMVMIAKLSKGRFSYPGALDRPHSWAYLPDLAATAVQLAEKRDELPRFADVPFEGYTLSGHEVAAILAKILGRRVRASQMSWWPIYLLAPFVKMFRGLGEMRYLWDTPHRLDGAYLRDILKDVPHTAPDVAFAQAIAHLSEEFEPAAQDAITERMSAAH